MRTRLIGFATVGVLALGAMVIGIRSGSPATARAFLPPRNSQIQVLPGGVVQSVDSGGRQIWALVDRPSAERDRLYVADVDAVTNRVHSLHRVPGPASMLYYDAGRVWVVGGGDGAAPSSRISVLDAVTGHVTTLRLGTRAGIASMAFADSTAYAAVPSRDAVLAVTLSGGQLQARSIHVAGGPTSVVALKGVILPANRDRNLAPIWLEARKDAADVTALSQGVPAIAAAGRDGVWARTGQAIERETLDAGTAPAVVRLRPAYRPFDVVTARDGGCYVSLPNPSDLPSRADLFYYSASALAGGSPLPTSAHSGNEIKTLAADPVGGVVYVDYTGRLWRWVPAGVPLR
ncbi:MAG TPA: hypothetical protein VG650_16665 [Mycobacteriales bacterium]|nr:hypothetical protein [Mycobacteriales bacterium]